MSAAHPPDVRPHPAIKAGKVDGPREETSLLAFVSVLLLHRRIILTCALAGPAIFGALAATSANMYISRASFLVRGTAVPVQIPGGAAAIRALQQASQFSQSVNFYADLVKAKSLVYPVAAKTYMTSDGKRHTLAEIYGIGEKDRMIADRIAGDRLIDDISSSVYSRSGVIGLAVKAPDPIVAQELATAILTALDQYGGITRQTQNVDERKFVEDLVAESRGKLDRAEESVATFLRNNREYENSPQLRMTYDRLAREVMTQQNVYTALQQSYEQARIEAVRDPAAINIVEPPDLPVDPARREAIRQTLLGFAAGAMLGIVIAFLRQRMSESRNYGTTGYLRFVDALRG